MPTAEISITVITVETSATPRSSLAVPHKVIVGLRWSLTTHELPARRRGAVVHTYGGHQRRDRREWLGAGARFHRQHHFDGVDRSQRARVAVEVDRQRQRRTG